MKQNFFPQQTHFLGVLLPEELEAEIEEYRAYMRSAYNCKSGQRTPLHVTLVPPFRLPDEFSTRDIESAIQKRILPKADDFRFVSKVSGFGAFSERTLFASVELSPKWTYLRDKTVSALLEACPKCTKKDARAFTPHITIANRDIPEGGVKKALSSLGEKELCADFPVNNITIFERKNSLWEIASVIEI